MAWSWWKAEGLRLCWVGLAVMFVGLAIFEVWAEIINNVRANFMALIAVSIMFAGVMIAGYGLGVVGTRRNFGVRGSLLKREREQNRGIPREEEG